MIFERHSGGKIFGGAADVCPATVLDRFSFISGDSSVWQSFLTISKVENGRVRSCSLEKTVFQNGEAVGSVFQECCVNGGTVLGSRIYSSNISGAPLIRESVLIGSDVRDHARVLNATLLNTAVHSLMRVEGLWQRTPRYFEINNQDTHVGVTEAEEGFAFIGCRKNKIADWLKKRSLFQKAIGWSDETIDEISENLKLWL